MSFFRNADDCEVFTEYDVFLLNKLNDLNRKVIKISIVYGSNIPSTFELNLISPAEQYCTQRMSSIMSQSLPLVEKKFSQRKNEKAKQNEFDYSLKPVYTTMRVIP